MTFHEAVKAANRNDYAERLAGAVKWLPYYLDQSSQCNFDERRAELASVLEQIDAIRDEIAVEVEDAIYLADPDSAADRRAW